MRRNDRSQSSFMGEGEDESASETIAHMAGQRPPPQPQTGQPSAEGVTGEAPAATEPSPRQRLIVVANRLPVSARKKKGGGWTLEVRLPCA